MLRGALPRPRWLAEVLPGRRHLLRDVDRVLPARGDLRQQRAELLPADAPAMVRQRRRVLPANGYVLRNAVLPERRDLLQRQHLLPGRVATLPGRRRLLPEVTASVLDRCRPLWGAISRPGHRPPEVAALTGTYRHE